MATTATHVPMHSPPRSRVRRRWILPASAPARAARVQRREGERVSEGRPELRARVRVGIAGWVFPPWRGTFYPPKLAQKSELEYASRALSTIELNGSFYSLQRPESYAKWHDQTPEDFAF